MTQTHPHLAHTTSGGLWPRPSPSESPSPSHSPSHSPSSSPPPAEEYIYDSELEWVYNKDTGHVLHEWGYYDCEICCQWAKHYKAHLFWNCPSLHEAHKARDSARSEARQELAALRQELQEVRQEVEDVLACLGDAPRRRQSAHRARTPPPLSTP